MKRDILIIFGITLIMTTVPVILLTAFSWYPLGEGESFIGEAVGGITAPFIGLLGALLIYYTFREQRKAIDQQRKAINLQEKANQQQDLRRTAEFYKSFFSDIQSTYLYLVSTHGLGSDGNGLSPLVNKEDVFAAFLGILGQYTRLGSLILASQINDEDKTLLLSNMFSWHISFVQNIEQGIWTKRNKATPLVFVNPILSQTFDTMHDEERALAEEIRAFLVENGAL